MADPPTHRDAPRPDDALDRIARAALAGDETAFELLHRRLGRGLQQFLARRTGGSTDLVEELSQRCWVEVWRAFQHRRYDPSRAAVTTYVYAIAYKVWLQHCRQHRIATAELVGDLGHHDTGSVDPTDEIHMAELIEVIRRCLHDPRAPANLSQEERCILQAVARGESDRSLAQQLGVAPSTANARKNAAIDKIRRFLEAAGFGENRERRDRTCE